MTSIQPTTNSSRRAWTKSEQSIVVRAEELAKRWHQGQLRKGDGQPFFVHPQAVANILERHGCSALTVAAGYCHDLLEDTQCSETKIAQQCGQQVLEIVKTVTHPKGLSWRDKREVYLQQIATGSDEARAVCAADKIHNLQALFVAYQQMGDSLWAKFNAPKEDKLWFMQQVLHVLRVNWQHPLVDELAQLVVELEQIVQSRSKDTLSQSTFFELDGKYAAMIPTEDGGLQIIKDPLYSIADYMELGAVISYEELPEDFKKSVTT